MSAVLAFWPVLLASVALLSRSSILGKAGFTAATCSAVVAQPASAVVASRTIGIAALRRAGFTSACEAGFPALRKDGFIAQAPVTS